LIEMMRLISKFAFASAFLLCLTDPATAQDAPDGEALYAACSVCHALEEGVHAIGPSLHGVFGRMAGSNADFRYSPAMENSGVVWSAGTLDSYLADPQGFMPGNRMPYSGMPDAEERAALIAYLTMATE
jgi:cytochrome c